MSCPRCAADVELAPHADWCESCEEDYATFVRAHATDIVAPVLIAMLIITTGGLVVPLLGGSTLIAAGGVFAGFGTLLGLTQLNRRRRRRQFLRPGIPQARLTGRA